MLQVGFLTSVLGRTDFESLVPWASSVGFDALEVAVGKGSRHIDSVEVINGKAGEIKKLLKDNDIEISSLAWYGNLLEANPEKRAAAIEYFKNTVRACVELEIPVACTLAGFAVPGKNKFKTISEDFADVFGPLVQFAKEQGVKIALENYFATLIQGLAHWDKVFEVVPDENLGLNFDPSHLYWQGIDYMAAVDRYAGRIFHTHAKDCAIKEAVLRHVGNQADGWWRYCIPGYGGVDWAKYVGYLKGIGYDGVLSIEHEDNLLGAEEGLIKGERYLRNLA